MINIASDKMHLFIDDHLHRNQPVSITRYGDGEAIILNGFNDLTSIKMVMKRQFGFVPPVSDIEAIISNLIEAYTNTDVIGIPTRQRLKDKNNYWYRAFEILSQAVGLEIIQQKQLTDIDFHSSMLDNHHFDTLLKGRETLCYISCRNLDNAFKKRYGIKKVYSYIIAPEAKFTAGYKGKPHYPDQFNDIKKWMTKIPTHGNLCLTGAGFTGKIYNNWFRDRGGIAADIGCVFDYWAGKVTRGPHRGPDSYDDKYKL